MRKNSWTGWDGPPDLGELYSRTMASGSFGLQARGRDQVLTVWFCGRTKPGRFVISPDEPCVHRTEAEAYECRQKA